MSEFAGLWEYELKKVLQKSRGEITHVRNHVGHDVVVRLEHIDPERISPERWALT